MYCVYPVSGNQYRADFFSAVAVRKLVGSVPCAMVARRLVVWLVALAARASAVALCPRKHADEHADEYTHDEVLVTHQSWTHAGTHFAYIAPYKEATLDDERQRPGLHAVGPTPCRPQWAGGGVARHATARL